MKERNLYLQTKSVEEAKENYMSAIADIVKPKYETISTIHALNRITGKAVYAKYNSPLFNAAAMDGIAVISSKTCGASESKPLLLKKTEAYIEIDTGDPIHPPYDAVFMAEDITQTKDGVLIFASVAPWQHVRPIGEDIVAGEMILPANHKIRPIDIGVLLSAGITKLEIVKAPTVAIFPTGTEMIEPEDTPKEGSIIESNSRMFENMVTLVGGKGVRFPAIPDDYQQIYDNIRQAVTKYDMIILNAGSSAGTEDYAVHVLKELGQVLVHGVAIKPGKPVILAIVKGKPVIGLPGYPVSAYIGFEIFVKPLLAYMGKQPEQERQTISAFITKRLVSSLKHKEYIRVKVGKVGEKMIAAPLARGAGAAMSLVRADGFCIIEQSSEGVEAGETVQVELTRDLKEVENTVVIIGSHDLMLDMLADMIHAKHKGIFISSTHVGSLGGLMALKRGEAHLAPIHLLDEETGEYNHSYVKRLFDRPMALIKGARRSQGILVKKGNPLDIKTLEDLKRCRYVNRQKGAGTRILLDYKLKEAGLTPEDINGYQREVTTHMAAAAAINSGGADAGMGILSVATAMDLDFIPITHEAYDLAIPTEYLSKPQVEALIDMLKGAEFQNRLQEMGGYDCQHSGQVVY